MPKKGAKKQEAKTKKITKTKKQEQSVKVKVAESATKSLGEQKKNKELNIPDILLQANYVSAEDIKKAKEASKKQHVSVVDFLLRENLVTKDLLGQAVAEFFKMPYADLNTNLPSKEQVLKIPEDIAKKRRLVLFREGDKSVIVTTDKPQQTQLLATLKKIFKGKKIELAYSISEDIDNSFIYYRKALETRFSKIIASGEKVAPKILDEIFNDALAYHASDIHLEPQADQVMVRFRIDGVLQEAGTLPKENYLNILNLIKVQARLRIDEHFQPKTEPFVISKMLNKLICVSRLLSL
jgi:type II secretory ATPase GspE/PulE/Tfp pilus assembly ATPase PilB-like protein